MNSESRVAPAPAIPPISACDLAARIVRAREAVADGEYDLAYQILFDLEEQLVGRS